MTDKIRSDVVKKVPSLDFRYFEESLNELIDFCKIIKNQNQRNQTLIKNAVSTRLVTVLEFNIKASVASLIDRFDLDPKKIIDDYSITIDIDFLNNLDSRQYSKGNILVAYFNNMNAKIIDEAFSRINKVDFFRWFDTIRESSPIGVLYPLINETYLSRNRIVHQLVNSKDSEKDLIKKLKAFKKFTFDLYWLTVLNIGMFEKGYDDVKCEKIIVKIFPNKSSSKFLIHFRKTTEKFRNDFKPKARRY